MKILNTLPPEIKKGQLVSMDFETYGQELGKLHRPTGTFACISVAVEGCRDVYQLYDHNDLKKLFSLTKKGIPVFHNALYDLRQFRRFVPKVYWKFIWDTMLVDQSMQGGLYQTFSLGDLSRRWLGKTMKKDVREDFSVRAEMTPEMKTYAATDAIRTLDIAVKQKAAYEKDPAFRAYTVADEPMIFPVLNLQGFRVDAEAWQKMAEEFAAIGAKIEDELGINVKSWQQVLKKAKSLGIHLKDTRASTLEAFADKPFIAEVLRARMYRDASEKYGIKWLDNIEADGRVYADYHITGSDEKGVKTGRMSCSNPNMQNIPQRRLPIYRERFIASDGNIIEVSDVSQQEPCIEAYHTQDANLLAAIRNKEDLHLAVARRIFNDDSLTKENKSERSIGKAINLDMAYGLTPYGLAARTGLDKSEAERMVNQYFRNFGGVFFWIGQQRQLGYKQGYVSTALGRRSYLNLYDGHKWENNAINSPIQGGAGDFMKVWARKTWEKCNCAGLPHTTVAWVHDETVRDIPRDAVRQSKKINFEAFQETAEQLYPGVPFAVEAEYGRSWGAKSITSEQEEMEDE